MRCIHRHEVQKQTRAFTTRQGCNLGVLLVERQAPLGQFRTAAVLGSFRHLAQDDLKRGVLRVHRFDLVLVEPAHTHLAIAVELARLDIQCLGDQLGKGRFTRTVYAQKTDTVIKVHSQVQITQDRLFGLIANIRIFQTDKRRRQRAFRRRQDERSHALFRRQFDSLQLLKFFDARLGLGRLGRLSLEAVDEFLKVGAFDFLLGLVRGHQAQLFSAGLFERIVVARIQIQLAVRQVQDVRADRVQQVAVVRNQQGGMRVTLQALFQPDHAFEVEIVGRFVQQQQVWFGKQCRRQCHAHTPATREVSHRTLDVFLAEAKAHKDFRGAGRGAVGVDLDQTHPDFAHLFRFGCFQTG